jgi:hypothetical protein
MSSPAFLVSSFGPLRIRLNRYRILSFLEVFEFRISDLVAAAARAVLFVVLQPAFDAGSTKGPGASFVSPGNAEADVAQARPGGKLASARRPSASCIKVERAAAHNTTIAVS